MIGSISGCNIFGEYFRRSRLNRLNVPVNPAIINPIRLRKTTGAEEEQQQTTHYPFHTLNIKGLNVISASFVNISRRNPAILTRQ